MAVPDAGEEAAWTKINGSSVHAHTDTYLCIVARSHSWIHINCVTRFHRTAENPYETVAWAAGYRFTYPVTRKQSFAAENCRTHSLYIFGDYFVFFLRNMPWMYEYASTKCNVWGMKLAMKINFGGCNLFLIWSAIADHKSLIQRERETCYILYL